MVYHFFRKFKEYSGPDSALQKNLTLAEATYTKKITLLSKIWRALEEERIDFGSTKELLALYSAPATAQLYEHMLSNEALFEKFILPGVPAKEIASFRALLRALADKAYDQQNIATPLLTDLLSNKLPEKNRFYELQESLKLESELIRIENKEFKTLESAFLLKEDPGSGTGKYVPILDAIKKGTVRVEGTSLFIITDVPDKWRPLQGLKIEGNMIILKGDHYGSEAGIHAIEQDTYVAPSLTDPFSYFVEVGSLRKEDQSRITRQLGCRSAEAYITLEIRIFPEQLYLKVQKNAPPKFAIVQLQPSQVVKKIQSAQSVAA